MISELVISSKIFLELKILLVIFLCQVKQEILKLKENIFTRTFVCNSDRQTAVSSLVVYKVVQYTKLYKILYLHIARSNSINWNIKFAHMYDWKNEKENLKRTEKWFYD